MQKKSKIISLVFLGATITILLLLFNYNEPLHTIVVHFFYVMIILSVLWHRKSAFYLISFLLVLHISLDGIAMQEIPYEAIFESIAQFLVAFILYWIASSRDESRSQMTELIEATQVGTWHWNFKTNTVTINDRWATMLGYTKKELSPITMKTWEKLAHPDDLSKSNEAIEKVKQGLEDFYEVDARMKHKDGHYIWIHDRGSITKHNSLGEPLVMSGTHTDITARKTMMIKEAYYRNLLDYIINHMNSGIAVHDRDLNYVYVSQKYLDQYNLSNSDIIGKHHYDVFPDLPERWKVVHQLALEGEVLKADRDPFPRADGTTDWTRWECRPWFDEKHEINGIIVYSEVINEQIETEQELEEKMKETFIQKEQIQATLLAIGDGVISTDKEGRVNAFNDIAEELTGYTKEEAQGMHFNDLFKILDEDTKIPINSPVTEVIKTGKMVTLTNHTMLIDKHGGEHLIEDSAAPIYNESNDLTGVILVFRDVTEKKHKQREIEFLSLHDYLTGVYNRRFFAEELARRDSEDHYPLGLMMIDLNGLKILNDAYGHDIGDLALRKVSEAMSDIFHPRGVISRIGGDEFTALVSNTSEEEMSSLKEQLKNRVGEIKIKNAPLSLAVGYTIKGRQDEQITNIIKDAEDMMYKLKLIEGASARNHTIQAILQTLTEKHELERKHSERVSNICYSIGEAMSLSKDALQELKLSGMFHDIGKISIPDDILNKPSSLNVDEYEVIKEHTKNGYQILRAADEYSDFAEHALYHHEKIDGSGYPEGLIGEEIPLFARIISVADAYEAMTSDRPYRNALSPEEAIAELTKYKGTQFDEKIVDIFLNLFEKDKLLLSTM